MDHWRLVLQTLGAVFVLVAAAGGLLWWSLPRQAPPAAEETERALHRARSEPAPEAGSEAERLGLERFAALFSDLTAEDLAERARGVYAADVYFEDTLVSRRGRDAVAEYLAESADALNRGSVELLQIERSDTGDHLVRWSMELELRRFAGGRPTRSLGVSHLRLDSQGRVRFHKDYWDGAGGLFEHLPVIGGALRRVRARL